MGIDDEPNNNNNDIDDEPNNNDINDIDEDDEEPVFIPKKIEPVVEFMDDTDDAEPRVVETADLPPLDVVESFNQRYVQDEEKLMKEIKNKKVLTADAGDAKTSETVSTTETVATGAEETP